jgi:hypothetical protein
MRSLGPLLCVAMVPLLVHCGRRSSSNAHVTSDPVTSASTSASDAGVDADADVARAIPTIACEVGPEVRFAKDPAAGFSCSPMRTSSAAAATGPRWTDEGGAAITPLDLTVAPGTLVSIQVGATNEKGASLSASTVRYDVTGFPPSAKIDPATRTFQWKAFGRDGEIVAGTVAVVAKLPGGEKCVKLPIVVRTRDDDDTRANQATSLVRTEQFYRQLACTWAHQMPMSDNAQDDLQDEHNLREELACGGPLVEATMRDLDGDGLSDAMVILSEHLNPVFAESPAAPKFEKGPARQILVRKGDDFVKLTETPGYPIQAVDGTQLFLDTNEVEHAPCPPRPYISTGISGCVVTSIEIYRWNGKSVEKLGEVLGDYDPIAAEATGCPQTNLEILRDAQKRVTGYRNRKKTYDWKGVLTTK